VSDDGQLLGHVIHRLRTSLAVIAGYSELGMTRDDAAIKAEAREAIATAVGQLTNGIDEVMLALELSWQPSAGELAPVDLREAVREALTRTALRQAIVELGDGAVALADRETVVRTLQALLRAAGTGEARVSVRVLGGRARATIVAAQPVALDDEELALRNARRLAELSDGTVTVSGARLELELPAG
jgi:light-regulated signal transduction histidine kinase (bacteriophytochrome)